MGSFLPLRPVFGSYTVCHLFPAPTAGILHVRWWGELLTIKYIDGLVGRGKMRGKKDVLLLFFFF